VIGSEPKITGLEVDTEAVT